MCFKYWLHKFPCAGDGIGSTFGEMGCAVAILTVTTVLRTQDPSTFVHMTCFAESEGSTGMVEKPLQIHMGI